MFPIRGPITKQIAACCIARLLVFATEDNERPVLLTVESPGGPVQDALQVISTMNGIKTRVATFVRGNVVGTAAVIAAHGLRGYRIAAPNAKISLLAVPQDSAHHQREQALLPLLAASLAKDTGKSEAVALRWLREGAHFTAAEALQQGLIDRISERPVLPA